jgi:HAD superfamily hydrolase (TIGR01509 family)
MKIHNVKAVIFDMDGLMFDSENLGRMGWLNAGKKWGYPITDKEYSRVIGRTVRDAEAIFKQIFGEDFPYQELRRHRVEFEHRFYEEHGVPLKPGLPELLDFLEARSLPKAVATSAGRNAAIGKLTRTHLLKRFQAIVSGDEVERGKPAPDIFLLAAQKLNIPAPQCMVLEDSQAGIRGAHAAGMIPVMVPDLIQPSEEIRQMTRGIVTSLYEIPVILA